MLESRVKHSCWQMPSAVHGIMRSQGPGEVDLLKQRRIKFIRISLEKGESTTHAGFVSTGSPRQEGEAEAYPHHDGGVVLGKAGHQGLGGALLRGGL